MYKQTRLPPPKRVLSITQYTAFDTKTSFEVNISYLKPQQSFTEETSRNKETERQRTHNVQLAWFLYSDGENKKTRTIKSSSSSSPSSNPFTPCGVASMKSFQALRSSAIPFTSFHDLLVFLISSSIVLRHVLFGLPLLYPRGFQSNAVFV